MKATLSAMAARSSTAKVILAIYKSSRRTLRGESTLSIDSRTAMRFRKPTLWPTNSAAMVVTVMIPSPPSWTSTMTTTAPNVVKVAGKSTVERPVTLPALTETNMASTHEMPCSVENGSLRSTVPSAISARKPTTISRGVESLLDNTFSRIVATQGLRTVTADLGQYTRACLRWVSKAPGTGRPKRRYNQGAARVNSRKGTMEQLTDSYNRKMDYLRISVTDRCNFRCQYCMPEDIQFQDKSHILTLEEMLTFAEACLQLGVSKVRVTGGEPLVRRGIVKFVSWLKDLGFEDVTMTTNGYLLEENLDGLVEAGLDRINISLDTLQPEKFAFITRRNHFEKVWRAVMAALETPLSPVKINAVAMRGVNDDEIADMARLTLEYPMHVRFIELMPLNGDTDGSRFRSLFIPGREILDRAMEELGDLEPIEKEDPAAPADEFRFDGAPGTFGVITPVSEPFCARCSRLRLTADGKIHPCLLPALDVSVKEATRSPDPIPATHEVLWHPARINPPAGLTLPEEARNRTMSQIGG